MIYKIWALVSVIVVLPWLVIIACVGWAALGSMLCWVHYGDAHMGVEGTKWLFQHCG